MPAVQPPTVDQMREQIEAHRVRQEYRQVMRSEHVEQTIESLADPSKFIDPREWGAIDQGYGNYDQRDESGHLPPFIRSEADLRLIRGAARVITESNPWLVGMLDSLTNYVIGQGAVVQVSSRKDAPDALVDAMEDFVDELLDDNDWYGDRDREFFRRTCRDGQGFIRMFPQERGYTSTLRFVEPDHVQAPASASQVEEYLSQVSPDVTDWSQEFDWSYGIQTSKSDVEKHVGFFIQQDQSDWDYAPEAMMVYGRRNVDRTVKPGLSDFFCVQPVADKALRLLRATLSGARLQARLGLITEMEKEATNTGTGAMLAGRSSKIRELNEQTPWSDREDEAFHYHGKFGRKVSAGPLGSAKSEIYLAVTQAAVRCAGARWAAPEFLISADASNANMASTMVAESPFVKAVQSAQYRHGQLTRQLILKAAYMAWRAGRFRGVTAQLSNFREIKRALQLDVICPQAETRDQLKETERRLKLMAEGIMLEKQVAAEEGVDWTDEHDERFAQKKAAAERLTAIKSAAPDTNPDDEGPTTRPDESGDVAVEHRVPAVIGNAMAVLDSMWSPTP